MILSWLTRRRRRKLLTQPAPSHYPGLIEKHLPEWRRLNDGERKRLLDLVRIFVEEQRFEGCFGTEATEEVRVAIAAQACLLLIGLDRDDYPNVSTILVYPTEFKVRETYEEPGGWVTEDDSYRLGEAHDDGPVVLAWDAVRRGGRRRYGGLNLVFHEFAHKLDMLDGLVDGTPPLKDRRRRRWARVMQREYERLIEQVDAGRPTLLDGYGATEPGEFFAVATECFLAEAPQLQRRHPELYGVLRQYYGQDPAARRSRSEGAA